MKETIMQYVNQYLPVAFTLLLAWIVRWGVKKLTEDCKEKNLKRIAKMQASFDTLQADLRSTLDELKECKSAMVVLEEQMTKVKGARK